MTWKVIQNQSQEHNEEETLTSSIVLATAAATAAAVAAALCCGGGGVLAAAWAWAEGAPGTPYRGDSGRGAGGGKPNTWRTRVTTGVPKSVDGIRRSTVLSVQHPTLFNF